MLCRLLQCQLTVRGFVFGREIEAQKPILLLKFNCKTTVGFCISPRLLPNRCWLAFLSNKYSFTYYFPFSVYLFPIDVKQKFLFFFNLFHFSCQNNKSVFSVIVRIVKFDIIVQRFWENKGYKQNTFYQDKKKLHISVKLFLWRITESNR